MIYKITLKDYFYCTMRIESENTREDYVNFLRYYYFKKDIALKIIISFSIISLISSNMMYDVRYHYVPDFLLLMLALSIITFLFLFLIPYSIWINRISKIFKHNKKILTDISLFEEGIATTTSDDEQLYEWTEIKSIYEYDGNICITTFNKELFLLTAISFASGKEKNDFYKIVQKQIDKVKRGNVNRLYRKGWFGLIPLVGAFFGLWLVIEGAFKYRDRKMIFIGIAAIMFTVIVYSSLIYYGEYSTAGREARVPVARDFLNTTMKDIEFYKTQRGYYPDSLEDLYFVSKSVSFHDPLADRNKELNKGNFYYKKIGNGYTLFSFGVDRKANTPDDLFPDLHNLDTSKIGFIRVRAND